MVVSVIIDDNSRALNPPTKVLLEDSNKPEIGPEALDPTFARML